MPRRPSAAVLAVLAACLLSACQLRLATDVAVGRDGGGAFEFGVSLDQELADALRDAGLEPLEDLEEVAAQARGWQVTEQRTDDGGLAVRLRASFDRPDGLGELADELHAGLDEEDVRVHEGLTLEGREDGSFAVTGRVGLRLPAAPGAEGQGVGFDAEDLQRLLDERGDELVRYDVRVTLPADPVRHDADEVDGASLRWRAPVGRMRSISAVSAVPGPSRWLVVAGVALAAAGVAFAVVTLLRRRG